MYTCTTAFVTEIDDPDELGRFTGRFFAHAIAVDGRTVEGPFDVGVHTALEWARRHAGTVTLLVGGCDLFTAGTTPVEGLPEWPDSAQTVRDRPLGESPLAPADVVPWGIVARVSFRRMPAQGVNLLASALARDPRVTGVRSEPGDNMTKLSFVFLARGMTTAVNQAYELADATAARVWPELRPGRDVEIALRSTGRADHAV